MSWRKRTSSTDFASAIREGGGAEDWLWRGDRHGKVPAKLDVELAQCPLTHRPLRYRLDFAAVAGRVEILDRSLIEIGDRCLLGHLTTLCSHMVAEVDGRPVLILKIIRIGEKSFIGADTQLGPGAIIEPRTRMKPKTRLYWRGEWQ